MLVVRDSRERNGLSSGELRLLASWVWIGRAWWMLGSCWTCLDDAECCARRCSASRYFQQSHASSERLAGGCDCRLR